VEELEVMQFTGVIHVIISVANQKKTCLKKQVSNSFGIIILAMELVGSHNVRQLKYGFCPVRQSSQQAYTVGTRLGRYESFNAKQSTRYTVL